MFTHISSVEGSSRLQTFICFFYSMYSYSHIYIYIFFYNFCVNIPLTLLFYVRHYSEKISKILVTSVYISYRRLVT